METRIYLAVNRRSNIGREILDAFDDANSSTQIIVRGSKLKRDPEGIYFSLYTPVQSGYQHPFQPLSISHVTITERDIAQRPAEGEYEISGAWGIVDSYTPVGVRVLRVNVTANTPESAWELFSKIRSGKIEPKTSWRTHLDAYKAQPTGPLILEENELPDDLDVFDD